MKPIKATTHDTEALIELGRASVQIVHDLKNQINGLKLYATFLRKRMERGERPADELETINKIMAGLERAATDMTTLVRLGRPLEIQHTTRHDLAALLAEATEGDFAPHAPAASAEENGDYQGSFDAPALTEALKNIHAGARSLAARDTVPTVNLRRQETGATDATGATTGTAATTATPYALIEWHGIKAPADHDIFTSFNGGTGLRLALAARVIQAHDGTVEQVADALRVRLPLRNDERGTMNDE